MDETIKELIEFLKTASPELWRIAVKQVYVNLGLHVFSIVVFIALANFSARKLISMKDDVDEEILLVLSTFATVVFAAWGFICLFSSIPYIINALINPEYLAIDVLTSIFR